MSGNGVLGPELFTNDSERLTIIDQLYAIDREPDHQTVLREAGVLLARIARHLGEDLSRAQMRDAVLPAYAVRSASGKDEIWTLVEVLMNEHEGPSGALRAARLLQDLLAFLRCEISATPREQSEREAIIEDIERTRVRVDLSAARRYDILCDGAGCGKLARLGAETQADADKTARFRGWLVSDEKDLCPECCAALGEIPPPPFEKDLAEGSFDELSRLCRRYEMPAEALAGHLMKMFPGGTLERLLDRVEINWYRKYQKHYHYELSVVDALQAEVERREIKPVLAELVVADAPPVTPPEDSSVEEVADGDEPATESEIRGLVTTLAELQEKTSRLRYQAIFFFVFGIVFWIGGLLIWGRHH